MMKKKRKQRIPGLPPGTLLPDLTDKAQSLSISLSIIEFNHEKIKKTQLKSSEGLENLKNNTLVTWVQVKDIYNSNVVKEVGKIFNLHKLIMEDIISSAQQAKINNFDEYLFILLNLPVMDNNTNQLHEEQISLVLGSDYLISFQASTHDHFNPIIERLEQKLGHIRKMKSDYLAYSLIDLIVDHFFVVLDKLEEEFETLDESITSPDLMDSELVNKIYAVKSMSIKLRKMIYPIRDLVRKLESREHLLIQESTYIFLHDVYEHTVQIIDNLNFFRDNLSSIHDVYLSMLSNRMNEVMKVLTIFASIFIPLTFLAGLYGMNFEYMPELKWPWAYPVLLGVMSITTAFMLFFFRKKNWIGRKKKKTPKKSESETQDIK